MRVRIDGYLPPDLARRLDAVADRQGLSRSAVIEAAVASFLSPDAGDRREAALSRRLDRLSRQVQRLERNIEIATEALALFVRFWLTVTPPLDDQGQAAAQAKGRERYAGFVDALGRRLHQGKTLLNEISQDVLGVADEQSDAQDRT